MSENEMILALGNALIMLDTVSAHGEQNWNALLVTKQQVRKVYQAMQEAQNGNHNEQGKDDQR